MRKRALPGTWPISGAEEEGSNLRAAVSTAVDLQLHTIQANVRHAYEVAEMTRTQTHLQRSGSSLCSKAKLCFALHPILFLSLLEPCLLILSDYPDLHAKASISLLGSFSSSL